MGDELNVGPVARRQSIEGSQLRERAYDAIEERIVMLEFRPGQVLSEVSVSRELGIGRTPVREALQRLTMDGLINILPSRGIIVTSMDLPRHLRLLETRRRLETLVAELAAQRATSSEREEFRQVAEQFRQAAESGNDRAFMDTDRQFNALLLTAAKNDYAAKCMRLMSGLSRRHFYYHRHIIDFVKVATLHARIADAVSERNVEDAQRTVNELMDFNETFTRRAIDTPWAVEST